MKCDNCQGTGLERAYEPWADCPDCDGTGYLWSDDDDLDDSFYEEQRMLYAVPFDDDAGPRPGDNTVLGV